MSDFADLLQPSGQDGSIKGTDLSFVDADTVRDGSGQRYRLPGISAPETTHFTGTGLSAGEVGGAVTTDEVVRLANSMGFTNLKPQLDENGQPVLDAGGQRIIGDLYDDNGRAFSKVLVSERVIQPHADYDPGGVLRGSADFGAFVDTGTQPDEWTEARNNIAAGTLEDQRFENQFKVQQQRAGDWHQWEQLKREGQVHGENPYNKHSAQFEYSDRDTGTGKALNPLSDAWDIGWTGVAEASYGVIEMFGESTGWDAAADVGTQGINRARAKIADHGWSITDFQDVNGVWDAVEYITNNAALSLPYMAISVGGAVAAPFTGGLSLTAPAAVYAGTTWNEMEGEKSAAIAVGAGVAQAALDRLGLGFIVKSGVAPKKLLSEAVENLVSRGVAREAAEAQVAAATRKELAAFAGDAARIAKQQVTAKAIAKDTLVKAGIGVLGEGSTEVLQEGTGYLAAVAGSDKELDWNELVHRLQNAAVAGSVLGGTFSIPGAAYNAGAWADVAVRQAPADQARLSRAGRYAEEEVKQHGRVKSIPELYGEVKTKLRNYGANQGPTSLDDRAAADKARKKQRTFYETLTQTALAAPSLWRGATRFIFTDDIQNQSRSARILADMFNANLQKTFSGAHFENEKHHRVTIYKNIAPIPEVFYNDYAGKKLTMKERGDVSTEVYNKLRAAIDEDGNFNPDLIPNTDPKKEQLVALQQQLETLSNKMYNDQLQHNPDLGYLQNYLLRYKSFDKRAIAKDKAGFIQKLVQKTGMTEKEAADIADAITGNSEINDFAEAFSIVQGGGGIPGSHQSRTLNLSEDAEFNDFMEKDLFANLSNAAKSAAKYTARQDFVGSNGEVVAQLLDDMVREGVSSETVNKIAAQMKDFLDAESGNYKRPTSSAGKVAERVQRNFMMVTTLAGLPLATISSFVELALTMRGLTADQVFGKGGLRNMATEFGDTIWKGMGEVASIGTRKQVLPSETEGKLKLRELGYYDWDVGAATTTGVTETNPWQQQFYEAFFKATGLQGWTNYTRAVRASMAGDYIWDKIQIAASLDPDQGTNETQEAREALRNIGINVEDMLGALDAMRAGQVSPEMQAIIDTNLREGAFNFVNDAVALPQSGNRPLIYQDPRFALFTQFQGFIATFTANHIPKLWGEYVKRGTPAMKYNAFAVMATMILLGFVSQHLKDLIKYGLDDEGDLTGHNPYLSQAEYIQRGIRSSGLLGTGERVLDQFFPLYEQRTDGPTDWLFAETTSQSPALSNLKRIGKAVGAATEGDVGKAVEQTLKSTPGFGPFSGFNKWVGQGASTWNFKGD